MTEESPKTTDVARRRWRLALFIAILVAGTLFKLYMFRSGRLPFDSDQASSAIGALRLLNGGEHRVFLCGQDHNGDIYSYYLLPFHMLFEPSVGLLRLSMIPLALLIAIGGFVAVRRLFGSEFWAFSTMTLLVFSPAMEMDWYLRTSATYVPMTIALLFSLPLFHRIIGGVERDGWTWPHIGRSLGCGALWGFAFWCHFSAIVVIMACLIWLAAYWRALPSFLGFAPVGNIGRWPMAARAVALTLQGLLIVASPICVHMLIVGGGEYAVGSFDISLTHLRNPTIILSVLTASIYCVTRFWLRAPARSRLGMLSLPIGLIFGAAPVVWYLWVAGEKIMNVEGCVECFDSFLAQLGNALSVGIPVLLGYHHNWAIRLDEISQWLRVAVLVVHAVALHALMIHARRSFSANDRAGRAGVFFIALFVMQLLAFSASQSGWFYAEPRYLLILYVVFATATGGTAWSLARRWGRVGQAAGVFLVGALVVFNIATCLAMPIDPLVGWSGETKSDRELLDYMEQVGADRAYSPYAPSDYWIAYRLTYIAKEKIIVAPMRRPGLRLRSERYQRAVDDASHPAYVIHDDNYQVTKDFFDATPHTYKEKAVGRYRVFHDVRKLPQAPPSAQGEQIRLKRPAGSGA